MEIAFQQLLEVHVREGRSHGTRVRSVSKELIRVISWLLNLSQQHFTVLEFGVQYTPSSSLKEIRGEIQNPEGQGKDHSLFDVVERLFLINSIITTSVFLRLSTA